MVVLIIVEKGKRLRIEGNVVELSHVGETPFT
jgi:hypothetical protein